jgi:hypothetical protein
MRTGIIGIFLILLTASCGTKVSYPQVGVTPGQATLTLPANNEPCLTGTVISSTQSSVTFTWTAAANADSYELDVKNLLTGTVQTSTTSATQLAVTLLSNTPYSWYIVAKTSTGPSIAQSDTWKFYNSGPGVVTYAPFPASIIAPTLAQNVTATNGTVNLSWSGSSVSANISYYSVYFGSTNSPALLQTNITNSFLNSVSVQSKTTYYWRVITVDANGNYSDSGLYQFTVN